MSESGDVMSRIFVALGEEFHTFEELVASSSLVVVGKAGAQEAVLDKHTHPNKAPILAVDSTITDFHIETLLAGDAPRNLRVTAPGGIAPDGTQWNVTNWPQLKTGMRYLLFLTAMGPGFRPDLFAPTGAYQGVFTVDAEDLVNPLSDFGVRIQNVPLEDAVVAIRRGVGIT